ncbi:MAG: protein phosphatase 2C domain-containing protein [Gemmatimonadota bacterium]
MGRRYAVGARSDTGQARERNEDAFGLYMASPSAVDPAFDAVFVVADGLGGHSGGDEASRLVVESTQASALATEGHGVDAAPWLRRLLDEVHRTLLAEAGGGDRSQAMGSTATIAVLKGETLTLGHVGDTRCYRLRDGTLTQITEDHSWVAEQQRAGVLSPEEAAAYEHRNWLTQSLGVGERLEIATYQETLQVGDRYLLCSDGLHGLVADSVVADVLGAESNPDAAAERLIGLANAAGGTDNITALVFDVHDVDLAAATLGDGAAVAAPRVRRRGAPQMVLGTLVLIGAAAVAAVRWTRDSAAPSPDVEQVSTPDTIPDSTELRVIPGASSEVRGDSGPNPQE